MSERIASRRGRGDGFINRALPWFGAIGVVIGVIAATTWDLAMDRHKMADSAVATPVAAIVGPPCPAVSAAAFQTALRQQELTLKYVFEFNGASFGRAIGYADCSTGVAKSGAPFDVCQFSSPAVLSAKTAKAEAFYLPGVGQRATVMTENGVPRCVMAAPKYAG